MKEKEYKIVKVPLPEKERYVDYPIRFPRMPRLYLELFENKAKIKQNLVNKEYVPKENDDVNIQEKIYGKNNVMLGGYSNRLKENEEIQEKYEDRKRDREKEKREKDLRSSETRSEDTGKDSEKHSKDSETHSKDQTKSETHSKDTETRSGDRSKKSETETQKEKSQDTDSESEEDELAARLKELLSEDSTSSRSRKESYSSSHSQSRSPYLRHDKYSRDSKEPVSVSSKYTNYGRFKDFMQKQNTERKEAPALSELEAQGKYHHKPEMRDVTVMSSSEYGEEDKKRELLFKFEVLRKAYPLLANIIPDHFTIHSSLDEMQRTYENTLKRLSLDSNVGSYKQYLIVGFGFTEYILGNYLNFDMQGFTQQQILQMHTYDTLLVELGEKSYVPGGSKWPVELRLLTTILWNAGVFIIGKMIMRSTGGNIFSAINSAVAPPSAASQSGSQKPKRKMKGPDPIYDDIPDVKDVQNQEDKKQEQ